MPIPSVNTVLIQKYVRITVYKWVTLSLCHFSCRIKCQIFFLMIHLSTSGLHTACAERLKLQVLRLQTVLLFSSRRGRSTSSLANVMQTRSRAGPQTGVHLQSANTVFKTGNTCTTSHTHCSSSASQTLCSFCWCHLSVLIVHCGQA